MKEFIHEHKSIFEDAKLPELRKEELLNLLMGLEINQAKNFSISVRDGGADVAVFHKEEGFTPERIESIVQMQRENQEYILRIFSKVDKYHLTMDVTFKFLLIESTDNLEPF